MLRNCSNTPCQNVTFRHEVSAWARVFACKSLSASHLALIHAEVEPLTGDGMQQVRLARATTHSAMRLFRQEKSAFDELPVFVVFTDFGAKKAH